MKMKSTRMRLFDVAVLPHDGALAFLFASEAACFTCWVAPGVEAENTS